MSKQMKKTLIDHCPVCGMEAETAQYKTQYHKMYFHFCSEQCREMFLATPKLYVSGAVETRSPVIKHRNLRFSEPCVAEAMNANKARLREMMGVMVVNIQGDCLQISYDLLQITHAHIEQALEKQGVHLYNSWWQRLRRGWVNNAEENELGNLARGSGACCNRLPPRV